MTINDIISHRLSAREFYQSIPSVPIAEAVKEPLKLGDLTDRQEAVDGFQTTFATALVRACLDNIIAQYKRKETMSIADRMKLAERIVGEYSYFTVKDLRTFDNMLINSRLPTIGSGGKEDYDIIMMDAPHFMSKLRVYDQKRPRVDLTPYQPQSANERAFTPWQQTHLLDGTEWDFRTPYPGYDDQGDAMTNALVYWREERFRKDERDRAAIESICAKIKQSIVYI